MSKEKQMKFSVYMYVYTRPPGHLTVLDAAKGI